MVFEHHYLRSIYKMRPQDGPQEMERNEAKAKNVAWPSCAWLLLSFFPFPMGHSVAAHGICGVCRLRMIINNQSSRSGTWNVERLIGLFLLLIPSLLSQSERGRRRRALIPK